MNLRSRILILAAALSLTAPACAGPVSSAIYPAPTAPLTLGGTPEGTRMVSVQTADGLRLQGLAVAGRPEMPTLLLLHGNASSATGALQWFAPFVAAGYGIVSAEYRGYSGNPGRPSEAGLVQDAEAFLALARQQAGKGEVWVVGHSIGGAVGLSLSRRQRLDALITIGTFTRLRAMAPGIARAFVPNEYDNLGAVRLLEEPFYLIHGRADRVVPSTQGGELFEAARASQKTGLAFAISGADHAPAAATLLPLFALISEHRRTGAADPAKVPPGVQMSLLSNGRSQPVLEQ